MRFRQRTVDIFAFLAILQTATSQFVEQSLSFGNQGTISKDGSRIPNWEIKGTKEYTPKLLSDRIILTPIVPGGRRGGVWATSPLTSPNWEIEVAFRTNGPINQGGGNLHLWVVKDKKSTLETGNVYGVDKFEGMAIVIDQYGGSGGSLRGFLNDGSTEYKGHHNVDKLAFGHCKVSYRNLGRMSDLEVTQNDSGFSVKMDGRECFRSDKLRIPTGYYVGVTAASADHADSFEVQKVVVISQPTTSNTQQQQQQQQQMQNAPPPVPQQGVPMNPPAGQSPPQASPFQQTSSSSGDMGQILQTLSTLTNSINMINQEFRNMEQRLQTRHDELKRSMPSGAGGNSEQLLQMARKIEAVERTVQAIQHDIEGKDYQDSLHALHDAVEHMQHHLGSNIEDSVAHIMSKSPRLGFFVFCVIAFQAMLAVSYIVYKRRRASGPKKLL